MKVITFERRREGFYNVKGTSKIQRALLVALIQYLDEDYMYLDEPFKSRYRVPIFARLGSTLIGPNVVSSNNSVYFLVFDKSNNKIRVNKIEDPKIQISSEYNIQVPEDAEVLRLYIGRAIDKSPVDAVLEKVDDKWKISRFVHRWKF